MIPDELWKAFLTDLDPMVHLPIADWLEEHDHLAYAWVWRHGVRATSTWYYTQYEDDDISDELKAELGDSYLGQIEPRQNYPTDGNPLQQWHQIVIYRHPGGLYLTVPEKLCAQQMSLMPSIFQYGKWVYQQVYQQNYHVAMIWRSQFLAETDRSPFLERRIRMEAFHDS